MKKRINYLFYRNEYKLNGSSEMIDEILTNWPGNYRLLEARHDFVQVRIIRNINYSKARYIYH